MLKRHVCPSSQFQLVHSQLFICTIMNLRMKIRWTGPHLIRSAGKYVHRKGERLPSLFGILRLFNPSNHLANKRRVTNSINESVDGGQVCDNKQKTTYDY